MSRPKTMKISHMITLNLEYEDYKALQEIVGKDNVSQEIRAMISNFLSRERKNNPLRLLAKEEKEPTQKTLDIYTEYTNLVKHIGIIEDEEKLRILVKNGKILQTVAQTRMRNLKKEQLYGKKF